MKARSLLIVFSAAALLLGLGHLTSGHDWGGDFAQYIGQAQSILDGSVDEFLEANRWTMERSYRDPPLGPIAYPWGLPLMLVPIIAAAGLTLWLLKLVGVLCFVLSFPVMQRFLAGRHATAESAFILALLALNPAMLASLNQIASDIPFLLVSTAALVQICGPGGERIPTVRRGVATGALICAACLVRSNGILLLAPLFIAQAGRVLTVVRRNGVTRAIRSLLTPHTLAPWIVFAVLFAASSALLPEGGSSHMGHLAHITAGTVMNNVMYYVKLPLAFYEGVPGRQVICLLSYPLALVGMAVRFRRDYPVILYLAVTLGIYVIWPDSMQGLRFLFPLLPFYLSFMVSGFSAVARYLAAPVRPAFLWTGTVLAGYTVAAMAISSAGAVIENQREGRPAPEGPYTSDAEKMFEVIRREAGSGDEVVFFKPRVMHFRTGLLSTTQREFADVPDGALIVQYRDDEGLVWPVYENEMQHAEREGSALRLIDVGRFSIFRKSAGEAP